MSKIIYTEAEKQQISDAIKKHEKETGSEIVPFFVNKSDNYAEAPFIASLIVSILSIIGLNILSELWLLPSKFNILSYSVVFMIILALTFLLFYFVPFLKIAIIPEKREIKMVQKRATEAFLSEEVFNTKNRTGILLFVSLLEHNIVILADRGINQKVKTEDWQNIVNKMSKDIKADMIIATVNAINNCKKTLLEKGFTNSVTENKLSDIVR
ncbi:MAG: hypothetical protein JXR68_00100 [Bacteroidales bacterium]|nr:hypothetical protein [Bacteroidales bacterium]